MVRLVICDAISPVMKSLWWSESVNIYMEGVNMLQFAVEHIQSHIKAWLLVA